MSFRVVLVENDSKLSLKIGNIKLVQGDKEYYISIKDINIIVIDNFETTLTIRLLEELAKEGVTVVICDKSHLPIGIYNGLNIHSRSSKIIQKQIGVAEEEKGEFWQKIVQGKIDNQKRVLEIFQKSKDAIDKLEAFGNDVLLDDKSNREAHSAKVYFNELFGKNFRRDNDDIIINSALNYGYAIVRSTIAKFCVGYGLNTTLGVFHKSEYNEFNLCDDLLEVFRPIVDIVAIEIMKDEVFFTYDVRKRLVNILNHKIFYNNKKVYLVNVIEIFVYSYCNFLNTKQCGDIEIPNVLNFEVECDEV